MRFFWRLFILSGNIRSARGRSVSSDNQETGREAARRPAVLIVDDQPDVAETGADMLMLLGYDASIANSAAAALERLNAGAQFDALFLDVGMRGGMSGLDLALIVRERFSRIAVLLTTGHGDALAEAQAIGFQVLAKPYFVDSLRDALRRLLAAR